MNRKEEIILIMTGGYRDKNYRSIAIQANIALLLMFAGAIGTNIVPRDFFGIPERFSVFAATGFNAVLGIYLFRGFEGSSERCIMQFTDIRQQN